MSVSDDGNKAIIGGFYDNGQVGAAWVWTRSGGVWTQQGNKLVGSGALGNAQQGASVSLSGDGSTAILGGNQDDSGTGAAWVFAEPQPGSCATMTQSNVFISFYGASSGCSTGKVCAANEPITFSASSLGYDFGCATHTFSWRFGDGSGALTQQQVSHSFPIAGSYTVTLTVTNAQASIDLTTTITVSAAPGAKRRAVAPPRSSANASPTLVSLSSTSVVPLQQLTLTGSGFDPAAITSVNFSDANGYSVTALAVVQSPSIVVVSVPPYLNPVTHSNGAGTVNVALVVQTAGGAIFTSNVLTGLMIGSLPSLTLPPGTVAANFLTFLRLSLGQVQGDLLDAEANSNGQLSFSSYRADLDSAIAQLSSLETTIRTTISTLAVSPHSSLNAGGDQIRVQSDQGITFDQQSLTAMDQLFVGISQSDNTVSGTELSKGGIECYALLKDGLKTVVTQAGNPQATIEQQFNTAKSLGGCAQAEIDSAKQFGAATSLALLALGPAMKTAIASQPELALAPGLLGWATVGIESYMLIDARDIACAADYLYPDAAEVRQLCITANEEIAKAGIEPVLGNLIELIRGGKYVVSVSEALDSGYELIPKSKTTVDLLKATDLWPSILSISCSPTTISMGDSSTCTVTISFAPLTGTLVTLTNNNPGVLTAPPSVTLDKNASTGTFTVTGMAQGTATITAGGGQTSSTAPTTVTVNALSTAVGCTYGYSDWSPCQSGNTQTRTVASRSPSGCIDIPPPVLSQACTFTNNACYTSWFDSSCTAFGPGGCWRCHNATYSGGECPSPFPHPYLSGPGVCDCVDANLYTICQ
ncbi:MAG TPA: PKD domain-containing protein [Thermoanaerobaculia bacterium]|nr:PKD domain-containing protein [Thermoanaerobaculia bacterium]